MKIILKILFFLLTVFHTNIVEANSLIPKDWISGPMKKGEGIKFVTPSKYVPNWNTLRQSHQQSLINGWQKEITNGTEQIQILKGLLGN